jgi:hypothetical protein
MSESLYCVKCDDNPVLDRKRGERLADAVSIFV